MRLTITIDMDNAAFEAYPGEEAGRILATLATRMIEMSEHLCSGWTKLLRGSNGNAVGKAIVENEPRECDRCHSATTADERIPHVVENQAEGSDSTEYLCRSCHRAAGRARRQERASR